MSKKYQKRSIYQQPIDPKKAKHYYVDGSYNPHTSVAGAAVLFKAEGMESYALSRSYQGKKAVSSTYAEHRAIWLAVRDAREKGYDLSQVIIHTDQEYLVSGQGRLKAMKNQLASMGIRLQYMPSTHTLTQEPSIREIKAYTVDQLAKEATKGQTNRYHVHIKNKRRRRRKDKSKC